MAKVLLNMPPHSALIGYSDNHPHLAQDGIHFYPNTCHFLMARCCRKNHFFSIHIPSFDWVGYNLYAQTISNPLETERPTGHGTIRAQANRSIMEYVKTTKPSIPIASSVENPTYLFQPAMTQADP